MQPINENVVYDGNAWETDKDTAPASVPVTISTSPNFTTEGPAAIQSNDRPAHTTHAEITVDPEVRGGVPCIGSNRRPISHILEKLASGATASSILQDYPDLTMADVQTALAAAAWVMRDPAINWSELNLSDMLDFQDEMRDWQSLSDDALDSIDQQSGD